MLTNHLVIERRGQNQNSYNINKDGTETKGVVFQKANQESSLWYMWYSYKF